MKNSKALLVYQMKYIYHLEIQLEIFFTELSQNFKTDYGQRFLEFHKNRIIHNKNYMDSLCRDIFLDPRGIYCKTIIGHCEDVQNLMASEIDEKTREMAAIDEVKKILEYRLASYKNLYKLAQKLKYYSISSKLQTLIEIPPQEEVNEVSGIYH